MHHQSFCRKLNTDIKNLKMMTNEQIEQKKLQLKQLAAEAEKLKNELVEAGAWPLNEEELDNVEGGYPVFKDFDIIKTRKSGAGY